MAVITWHADAAQTFVGAVGRITTAMGILAAVMSSNSTPLTDHFFASGCASSMTITQHLRI